MSSDERAPAPAGNVVAPLVLAALAPPAAGTTPDVIQLTLSSNLDTVSVRSRIIDADAAARSECQVADVYRVGPSAVEWPIGAPLTLPLAYTEQLPDGLYVHAVSLGIGAFGNHWLRVDMPQHFEVTGGALQSLSSDEFQRRAGGTGAALPAPSADPCPALPDYSDETTFDGATSRVEFDSWQQLGTIQPLRWVASAERPFVGALPSMLTFHALLPNRGRLQVDLLTPADIPADFDATFPEDGRILLDELGSAPASWKTLSGRASVRIDEQGHARVELADIVLERAGRMQQERSIPSGLLTGEIVPEVWP